MRQLREQLTSISLIFVSVYGCLIFFGPPFFTYDSYDYLSLSLNPKYGSAHPLAFGELLALLANISDLFGKQYFTQIVVGWNALGIAVFLNLGFIPLKKFLKSKVSLSNKLSIVIPLVAATCLIVPALLFVSNAFWSEATAILQLTFFCYLVQLATEKNKWLIFFAVFFLSAWSYNTRYAEIIMPASLFAVAALYWLRNKYSKLKKPANHFSGIYFWMAIFSASGIIVTSLILKSLFPTEQAKHYLTNFGISASVQCTLRCESVLFTTNCNTEQGRKIVEESKCSDLVFGLKPFGASKFDLLGSHLQTFKYIGPYLTIKWLLSAPIKYLTDTHAMEMGMFQFGNDTLAVKAYPEATNYYLAYFKQPHQINSNPNFISLVQLLDKCFSKLKVFHILTVISVLLSIFLVYSTSNTVVLFLSFKALGTYLLLAYFNPHVPFRYLLFIIAPIFIASIIHFLGPSKDMQARD